jgi:multiple inositol-polyphosphate phosphatase / 2,3-bisphosphoglycerate 3-phosphatase
MKGQSICFFVLFNAAVLVNVNGQEEYCYANDADKRQTKHFATKTPYEVAHGSEKRYFNVPSELNRIMFDMNRNFHSQKFIECEAVKFWLIARHGTRNPSAKSIEKLKDLTAVNICAKFI